MVRPIKPVELLVGHAPFLEQWTIDLTSVTVDRYVLLTLEYCCKIWVSDHSRSLKMASFDRSHIQLISAFHINHTRPYLVSFPIQSQILVTNCDFVIPHLHSTLPLRGIPGPKIVCFLTRSVQLILLECVM